MESVKRGDDYWPLSVRVKPTETVRAEIGNGCSLIFDVGKRSMWIEDKTLLRVWQKEEAGEVCLHLFLPKSFSCWRFFFKSSRTQIALCHRLYSLT